MANAWTTLRNLPAGFFFVTRDGVMAVKSSRYHKGTDEPICVLLGSGDYAEFPQGNDTQVTALEIMALGEMDIQGLYLDELLGGAG